MLLHEPLHSSDGWQSLVCPALGCRAPSLLTRISGACAAPLSVNSVGFVFVPDLETLQLHMFLMFTVQKHLRVPNRIKKKKTLNRGVRDKAIYVSDRATDITRWYNVSFVGSSLWNFSAVKGPFSHHHLLCHLISNLFEVVQESVTACIGTRAQKASLTL